LGLLKNVGNSLGLLKDGWNNFGSVEKSVEQTSGKTLDHCGKKLWVCCKNCWKCLGLLKRQLKKLGSVEKAIETTLGLLKRVLKKRLVY
jgi:hypothetical protein